MIIFWYLTRSFCSYVAIISVLMAFLYNFIEFFEKLVRVKHTTIYEILYFVGLNFIPGIFDFLPIAIWLATCLILKELLQRNEWDLLQFLSFIPFRLCAFIGVMGLGISITALYMHESIVATLVFRAERFKQEHFKEAVGQQQIINRWFELEQGLFCYMNILDLKTNQGKNLLLIQMSPQFEIQKLIRASNFSVDPKRSELYLSTIDVFDQQSAGFCQIERQTWILPGLFSQIGINFQVLTLQSVIYHLLFHSKFLPIGMYRDLLGQMCKKIAYSLQLFLYPLLTITLFLAMAYFPYIRWIAAFLAYPIMLMINFIGTTFFNSGLHAFVILLPYLIMGLGLWLWWVQLKRKTVKLPSIIAIS